MDGIDKQLIGVSSVFFQYPVLFRQLVNLIAKDDSFINFTVLNISKDNDNTIMEVQVSTRIDEIINQQLILA
jgi:hypothetical protein